MLAITNISPGRMGNHLFHYHFLRQLAKKTDIGYFHIKLPESNYFMDMQWKPKLIPGLKKPFTLTSSDVLFASPDEIISTIKQKNNQKIDVILVPPMLGEVFFDFLFYDPNEFLQIRKIFTRAVNSTPESKIKIALHFRGTDFLTWNINAALKFDYYRAAIDDCLSCFAGKELLFSLFTDDVYYPPYLESIQYIEMMNKEKPILGNPNQNPIYDFYTMSQSDVLISSPSTFAIFAGMLGKTKKIIHSKQWLEYSINRQDTFWVRLAETNNPYYKIWKTI